MSVPLSSWSCPNQSLLRAIAMNSKITCRLVQPLWKAVWIPQKIRKGTAFQPSSSTSGNISERTPNTNSKEHKRPMFTAPLFTISKIWKQPKCPSIDEWIKQLWDIYTWEFYLAVKKNKTLPFATVWMDLENIVLSKISQSEKDKYHIISLISWI